MKIILIVLLFFTTLLIHSDDDKSIDYFKDSIKPAGALLFAENCLKCHQAKSFIVTEPNEDYVIDLAERIEYYIYSPVGGMYELNFLTFNEVSEIARFLIYGSHVEGWLSMGIHGGIVEERGSDTCMKCHNDSTLKEVEISSCINCH